MNKIPSTVRIQRKRVKGWRMPENTISVTRPSVWGNPFFINDGFICFKTSKTGYLPLKEVIGWDKTSVMQIIIDAYRQWINGENWIKPFYDWDKRYTGPQPNAPTLQEIKSLKGKNLACFCPIGSPCHADVLLQIANTTE